MSEIVSTTLTQVMTADSQNIQIITQGTQGPAGQGLPTGGSTGQYLRKNSATNFDYAWMQGISVGLSTISASSYTLGAADSGTVLRFTSNSAITLTCPNNLPAGFHVGLMQLGNGQITPVAASGASIVQRNGFTKTAGLYAAASLIVQVNAGGSAASYLLAGDCA
jgi:hypothetical protein